MPGRAGIKLVIPDEDVTKDVSVFYVDKDGNETELSACIVAVSPQLQVGEARKVYIEAFLTKDGIQKK